MTVLSITDALEGFHLAAVVRGLDELGVMDLLAAPTTAAAAAGAAGVDARLLHVCLEYIAGRTDLVHREGDAYRVTSEWGDHARAAVRQYAGAYAAPSLQLVTVLRNSSAGALLIDHEEHAAGYRNAPTVSTLVADLVLQLDLTPALDLGCGPATMLLDLAKRTEGFVGWGVDHSPAMVAEARSRIVENGLGDRVTVVDGDALAPDTLTGLPFDEVRSITATSLLNELWDPRGGRPTVAAWLASVGVRFPGRPLVVTDYFGRLGHVPPPWPRQTALHDLVQALSGQGVPPPDHDAWSTAYRDAGAQLLHMIEDKESSFFIHLVRLP